MRRHLKASSEDFLFEQELEIIFIRGFETWIRARYDTALGWALLTINRFQYEEPCTRLDRLAKEKNGM